MLSVNIKWHRKGGNVRVVIHGYWVVVLVFDNLGAELTLAPLSSRLKLSSKFK